MTDSPGRAAARGDSMLQELQQLREQAGQARQPFERPWYLNLAAYQGQQWHFFQNGRFHMPAMERHRVMFTDNRIIGIIRTEIAKLTKDRPVFVVTPKTGEDDDIRAAGTGERVLEFLWNDLRLNNRLRSALLWARVCSAGFWKVYWDSQKGERAKVLVDADGNPMLHPQTGRMMRPDDPETAELLQMVTEIQGAPPEPQTKEVARGDACVEVRSPFEIFPDPLAEEGGVDEAEWIIEESVRSRQYVQERYNVELEPDTDAVAGITESRMPGNLRTHGSGGSYKGIKVVEFWHRPGSKYPNGKRVAWAGNKVLEEDKSDYDELPYIMFSGIPVPGRFWPTSTVEQTRSVNVEMNKTRSQIRENAARFGNPSLLKPRQSNVEWSGLPGEQVEFDITFGREGVPDFMKPPEMPAYVQAELDRMEVSLREISGQHEIAQGKVPTGVTAASAINLLQEQDETRLAIDVMSMEDSLALAGSKILDLVARFYTDERTIRVAGEDAAWDIFAFRGSMLRGNTQVEVQAGSGMPRSKAAKQAAMQELLNLVMQYGVDVKPRDLRKFFKDYEVGGLERLFASIGEDERQINRENRLLATGPNPLSINSFDDDLLHIEGHEEFQKTARYDELVARDPAVGTRFEAHVREHRTRFINAQEAAAPPPPPESGGDPNGQSSADSVPTPA